MPTPRQAEILAAVIELGRGDPPNATTLAKRFGMTRQAATQALEKLERQGLLENIIRPVRTGTFRPTKAGLALAVANPAKPTPVEALDPRLIDLSKCP